MDDHKVKRNHDEEIIIPQHTKKSYYNVITHVANQNVKNVAQLQRGAFHVPAETHHLKWICE